MVSFDPLAIQADKKLTQAIIHNCCNFDGIITPRGKSSGQIQSVLNEIKSPKHNKKRRKRSHTQISTKEMDDQNEISEFYMLEIITSENGNNNNNKLSPSFKQIFEISPMEISYVYDKLNIESLHELKISYKKLQKLCLMSYNSAMDEHWFTYLDGTNWLQHISTLMKSTHRIVELMDLNCSILLNYHEKQFDRGCQISSLSQLWMDPYYRTLDGFITLIEKEWISNGHPFLSRNGYYDTDFEINNKNISNHHNNHTHIPSLSTSAESINNSTSSMMMMNQSNNTSQVINNNQSFSSSNNNLMNFNYEQFYPVFIQFLDCVWQTLRQFPHDFEFNNNLLIDLASNCFSGHYGNFIYNNENQRISTFSKLNTISFWDYVLENKSKYINPLYIQQNDLQTSTIIIPSYDSRSLLLWSSYFLRWYPGLELISLPRNSTNFSGVDILAMETRLNARYNTAFFASKLHRLKEMEKNLKRIITFEKDKVDLLSDGYSIHDAYDKALLKKLNSDDLTILYPNSISATAAPRRKANRSNKRRSTPSISKNEVAKLFQLEKEVADDMEASRGARSARTFSMANSEELPRAKLSLNTNKTSPDLQSKKKKPIRRSLSRKLDSVLFRKNEIP